MSLAKFLLAAKPSSKKRAIDTELDAIFHSRTAESRLEPTSNDQSVGKKKKKHKSDAGELDGRRSRCSPSIPSSRKANKGGVGIALGPGSGHKISDTEKSESADNVSVNGSGSESSDESDEDSGRPPTLIHDTLRKDKTTGKKTKYAPPDETKERRDARTIFVGNIAPDVAIQRSLQKQLHRHILASIPTAKIESTRFRSVAFKTPTSKPLEANDEVRKHRQLRQHERDRASSWRDANSTGEPKTDKESLTPGQKKKIAFIKKDIHSDADSIHAYIVFAYPLPHSRPTNLPPLPPVMDPFEATRLAIEKCNGTIFLDRMLRVNTIVKQPLLGGPSDNRPLGSAIGDPKLSIFVGNLDFVGKEEDLRVFFEGVVSAERGPPDSDDGKSKGWVTRIRMVRDKDTQLGKGFAYVQFSDRTCVDEILALEPGKLKFAKRKLRVQRCKSVLKPSSDKKVLPSKPAKAPDPASVQSIPKGDPSLGERLVKLTKEERKRVKAADADRVARRVAKKKARMALAKQGVPPRGKQRERTRKTGGAKKLGGATPKKAGKGRVRSDQSMAKRNAKK